MTPSELTQLVAKGDIYKISLGKTSAFRQEALRVGSLIFFSVKNFYNAVISGDEGAIAKSVQPMKSEKYPRGGAPKSAWSVWRDAIHTFENLPVGSLIVHWDSDKDVLRWGIAIGGPLLTREEYDQWAQPNLIFYRPLADGWRDRSLAGVPLTNIHPKARDISVNPATINRVQTDGDYLRNLILGHPTDEWEQRAEWRTAARKVGWRKKDPTSISLQNHASRDPLAAEIADFFADEAVRMADTALQTAAYANGQSVLTTMKEKSCEFSRDALISEIERLLKLQKNCCALTHFEFKINQSNAHLKPSLDRIDSALGYIQGNLQIVTRSANFFKSASDAADWRLKASAMEKMAYAMQQKRKQPPP